MVGFDEAIEYVKSVLERDKQNIDSFRSLRVVMEDLACLERLENGKKLMAEIKKVSQ